MQSGHKGDGGKKPVKKGKVPRGLSFLSVRYGDSSHDATMKRVYPPTPTLARALLLSFVAYSSTLQGCIKYTPSRGELEQRVKDSGGNTPAIGSEEEFNAYERSLADRLQMLISERAYLLTADNSMMGYVVGPGDVLQVDVYGFGDLKTDAEVSPQGTVSLPLVGEVDVKGRDTPSLRKHLTSSYSRYIRNPRIDVSLKTYQSNRVSVIGEVSKPGMYPLRRNGQLLTELISEAGGRSQIASNRLILLPAPRMEGLQSQGVVATAPDQNTNTGMGVEIEMDALIGKLDQRPLLIPLMAGDTVVVPEAGNYEVDGEVVNPGSYKLASSTSVIGAVAAAGGLTYSADVKKVEVIRDIGGGKKALAAIDLEEVELQGGKDIRLRAGDLVRVPSEPGRFFEAQVVSTLNGIFNGVAVNKRVN